MREGSETTPTSDELAKFALAEGVRTLTEQTANVRSIKDRAVALVGLTATAVSFLVGAVLNADPNKANVLFFIGMAAATVAFASLLWFTWRILSPVPEWRNAVGPTVIMDDFDRQGGWRELAGYYSIAIDGNDEKLDRLGKNLQRATAAAGSTVVLSILMLWYFG